MSGICDTWSEYYDERTRTYSIPCEALFQGCGDESESNYGIQQLISARLLGASHLLLQLI